MSVVIDGTNGVVVSGNTNTLSGVTVSKGGGNVATNTAVGASALASNTTAGNSVALGYQAAYSGTTLGANIAIGASALYTNNATANVAVGYNAAFSNTTGYGLVAVGGQSMISNTTGSNNTAVGGTNYSSGIGAALYSNTTGSNNIAVGTGALNANTTTSNNTAVGYQAGYTNNAGGENTFVGYNSGYTSNASNANAGNTCIGARAGYALTTGLGNTFVGGNNPTGYGAGFSMTTGSYNTIVGCFSGNQNGLNIAAASNYIVLADGAGNPRAWWDNNGSCAIPRVYINTTGSAANVNVDSNGYLARSTSSLKYKRDVEDATHGLAEVMTLRSVTYKSKTETDGDTVYGGLIAEEVHAAGLTEFVQYAEDGTPDALAYSNMVSLCVKAIQELNAKVDAQAVEIAALKAPQ